MRRLSARRSDFFRIPASDYGRLNLELMRAVRLVVDTGIHSEGWTREQAVAYFRESGAADEPTIQAEINRYIAWPVRASATRSVSSRFSSFVIAQSSNLAPASISGPSMMKSSAEEACRSTCWNPASITGLEVSFRIALVDENPKYSANGKLSRNGLALRRAGYVHVTQHQHQNNMQESDRYRTAKLFVSRSRTLLKGSGFSFTETGERHRIGQVGIVVASAIVRQPCCTERWSVLERVNTLFFFLIYGSLRRIQTSKRPY